jgi:multidrug resistance efflux pump
MGYLFIHTYALLRWFFNIQMYEHVTDPATKRRHAKGVVQLSSTLPTIKPNTLEGSSMQALQTLQVQQAQQARVDAKLIEALRSQVEEANATLKQREEEVARLSASVATREMELARLTKAAGTVRWSIRVFLLLTHVVSALQTVFILSCECYGYP